MVAHIRITKVHNYMKDEIINISLFVSQGIKIINEIKYNKLWKMIYKITTHDNTQFQLKQGPSWPWSYGSWICNYLCNQCLSPLVLWVRISIRARCKTLHDKVCQWFATGRWFSPGPPVSSTNKTDRHDITEILLKVALNTINQSNKTKHQFKHKKNITTFI